jgi:hypothetical protein
MVAQKQTHSAVKTQKAPKVPKEPKVAKAKKMSENPEGEKKKREKKPKTGYWWGEAQKLPSAEELEEDIDESAEGKRVKYKTLKLTTFQQQLLNVRAHEQKLAERFETSLEKVKERLAKTAPEKSAEEVLYEKLRRQKEVRLNGFSTRVFHAMKAILNHLGANVSLPQKSVLTLATTILKMINAALSSAKVTVVVKRGVTLTPVIVSSVFREWIDRDYPGLIKFDPLGIPVVVFPSEDEVDKASVLPAEDNIRQMIKGELGIACVSKDSVFFVQRTYAALAQAITKLAYDHMLLKKSSKKNKASSKAENSSDSEEEEEEEDEEPNVGDEDNKKKRRKKGSFLMVAHIIAVLEIKKIPYNQVNSKVVTYERKPRAPPKKKKADDDSVVVPKKKKKTEPVLDEEDQTPSSFSSSSKNKKVSGSSETHTKKKKNETSHDEDAQPQLSIRKPKKHDIADEETQPEPTSTPKKAIASSHTQEEEAAGSDEDQTSESKISQSQAGPGDSDEDME